MAVALKKIGTLSLTAGADNTFEFSKFPLKARDGMIPYLRALRMIVNITATATGAVTQRALYELIRNVSIEVPGGGFFGPKGLSGTHLAALGLHADGRRTRKRGNGDAAVSGAGAANRTIALEFAWDKFGKKKSDNAPAIPMLANRGAQLTIGLGSQPANFSAMTVTVELQALIEERAEHVAVPVLTVERRGIDTLTKGSLTKGRLVLALLERKTQAFDADDIDTTTLYADGLALVDKIDPNDIVAACVPGRLTTDQAAFSDVIGETDDGGAVFARIFPATGERISIGSMPVASQFTYDVEGTITQSDASWLVSTVSPLRGEELSAQMRAMGAPLGEDALANPDDHFAPKTESKKSSVRSNLAGAFALKANV